MSIEENDHDADISKEESEIDRLVYQLYGLTDETPNFARLSTYDKKKRSETPSFARLSTYDKKEMGEEIRIVEGKE